MFKKIVRFTKNSIFDLFQSMPYFSSSFKILEWEKSITILSMMTKKQYTNSIFC